jgi:hypothetical protein
MHFEKREGEEDTFGKRFMKSFESRGAERDRQRESFSSRRRTGIDRRPPISLAPFHPPWHALDLGGL